MSSDPAPGSTPGTLRFINSRALLDELLRPGGAPGVSDVDDSRTVTELAGAVGLSRPTVEAALADLVDEGWVAEADAIATPNKAGRRAKRFRVDATAGHVVGVDLGLHAIVGVLADLRGEVVARVEQSHADLVSAEQAWVSVQDVVRQLVEGIAPATVLAATFGVPAVVDRSGAIDYTIAAPEWLSARVPGRIDHLFPNAATVFDNDAKLAATAEAQWGALVGVDDALLLVMGRQIGAALVVGGTVVRGAHGAAGEIGAMGVTGWPGAPARLEARIPSGADLESVMAAAGDGDPEAADAVRALAADVAPGVAQLVAAIDPARIVVGGEVLPAADVFCAALAEAVAGDARHPVPVVAGAVGRDAVALGALARSLGHVRTELMRLG